MTSLDIYGYRVEIRSTASGPLENLADDFAFFRSDGGPGACLIELLEEDPPYDTVPTGQATVYTPRNVSYKNETCTFIDYSGRGLAIHDRSSGNFRVFSRDLDLLYEAAYLFLLSQCGEALDARGMHRVHALCVSVDDCAALVLLPMGGGKSTLGSQLLSIPEISILSDDSPLIDRKGDVHAFPLRLGLLPGSEGAVPASQLRRINRMEFGPKLLVNYRHFADRVRPTAKPCLVFLGARTLGSACEIRPAGKLAALRAMLSNCVVGLGLFQGMEFVFQRGLGAVFGKAGVAWARLRASRRLLARSQTYHLLLGRDTQKNARVVFEFIQAAAKKAP